MNVPSRASRLTLAVLIELMGFAGVALTIVYVYMYLVHNKCKCDQWSSGMRKRPSVGERFKQGCLESKQQ
jgi:hypothetical protein